MTRPNDFTRGVRIAVRLRATKNGVAYCENCGLPTHGDHRVDHRTAASLDGSRKIENAWLLGKCCYAEKDANDNAVIKRLTKSQANFLGVAAPKRKIGGRGFDKQPRKSRCGPTSKTLPRKPLWETT